MKYMLSQYDETPKPYEKLWMQGDKTIFLNPYALPLCFTMNNDCIDINTKEYDHFSYQNALARSFGYEGDDIYKKLEDVKISLHNLDREGNTYKVSETGKEAYIEISFINSSSDFIYMYLDADDFQDTNIVANGLEKQPYFTSYGWSIREVGHFPVGEQVNVRISLNQDMITLNSYEFYYEDKTAIADWYKEATKDKSTLEKITSSHLMGKVNASKNKTLVFSIPYENVWKVYVDGMIAENREAAGGLLAVDIAEGEHDIELTYVPKGFILGMPLSIAGLVILLVIAIRRRRYRV
jgi:uncharacterized membrane protein YfhO